MSKSALLRLRDLRALYDLVGECRDLGDDPRVWLRHWLAGLARLIDADLAIGGELAGLSAGVPRDLGAVDWGWDHGFNRAGWLRALELLKDDPTYSSALGSYGRRMPGADGTALCRSELVDERAWERTAECQEVYHTIGGEHAIYCLRSLRGVADEVNAAFLIRASGRRDFGGPEKGVVREAYAVIGPLVGGPLARFTDPSPAELPPRVRQVLRCLLEGDGDKQVAARLRLSPFTVNQYVKQIFKHFGVSARPELLARWIRRGWGNRFAWAD